MEIVVGLVPAVRNCNVPQGAAEFAHRVLTIQLTETGACPLFPRQEVGR